FLDWIRSGLSLAVCCRFVSIREVQSYPSKSQGCARRSRIANARGVELMREHQTSDVLTAPCKRLRYGHVARNRRRRRVEAAPKFVHDEKARCLAAGENGGDLELFCVDNS